MFDVGVSAYLGLPDYSKEEVFSYLNQLPKLGIHHVFSSFHMGEATNSEEILRELVNVCEKNDIKLTLDISKKELSDYLIKSSIYSLRLDYGFTEDDIIELSKIRIIELNASTIKEDKILRLISNGLEVRNTRFSFNFYPKPYTGHDLSFVCKQTKMLKSYDFYVAAFIPSMKNFRPPLYLGLPTVENHRKLDLDISIEELKLCGLDGIYYGDSLIEKEEIELLAKHNCDELLVKLESNVESLYDKNIRNRSDGNSLLIRINGLRIDGNIEPNNTNNLSRYDVTDDNKLLRRYMGEVNIVLKDLANDGSINVIGRVISSDFIIENIKESRLFRFIK